ncbi:MAG: sensor histidine kinase [Cyanobacteria bacterium J06621_11]
MVLNPPSPYRLSPNNTAAKPLRLLLYVEWILLSMGALMSITVTVLRQSFQIPWIELSLVGLISLMGLYLPLTQLRAKIIYTVVELALLGIVMMRCLGNPLMMRIIPLLGLVIMIRSCQIFQTQGRLVVTSVTFGLHLLASLLFASLTLGQTVITQNLSWLVSTPELWQVSVLQTNVIILLTLVLLFVFLLVDALLSVHRNQQKLEAAHAQLQQYALQVEGQAALQERTRIAREIHDSLGHSLTAQTILLENVLLFWEQDTDQAKSYLLDAKASSYQALKEVSRAVAALRDAPQTHKPLQTAIPELVNKVCHSTSMTPSFEINITTRLPDDLNLAAYRIVQEALTNTVKHAQATQLSVKLFTKPQSLYVQVLDNGRGFDPSKNTTGFGLRGMKERALALGGTCQIWSSPRSGCRISAILPFPQSLVPQSLERSSEIA